MYRLASGVWRLCLSLTSERAGRLEKTSSRGMTLTVIAYFANIHSHSPAVPNTGGHLFRPHDGALPNNPISAMADGTGPSEETRRLVLPRQSLSRGCEGARVRSREG